MEPQQQQQPRTWQERQELRRKARALYGATTMAASRVAKAAKRLGRSARRHAIASLKYSAALPSMYHTAAYGNRVLELQGRMDLALYDMQTAAHGVAAASDAVAEAAGKWDDFCQLEPAEEWCSFLLGMPAP
jgi:hypothetical protein